MFFIQVGCSLINPEQTNRLIKRTNEGNLTMLKIVKTSLVIAASTLAFSNAAQANDVNEATRLLLRRFMRRPKSY